MVIFEIANKKLPDDYKFMTKYRKMIKFLFKEYTDEKHYIDKNGIERVFNMFLQPLAFFVMGGFFIILPISVLILIFGLIGLI